MISYVTNAKICSLIAIMFGFLLFLLVINPILMFYGQTYSRPESMFIIPITKLFTLNQTAILTFVSCMIVSNMFVFLFFEITPIKRHSLKVAVCGGFDPVHIGHIRHFRDAKRLGDELIVILNTDRWLKKKKGYIFMPYKERKEIIESIKYVDKVVKCIDTDGSVSKTLAMIKPDIFAKGGDRNIKNIPMSEIDTCKRLGIRIVCGVGGKKIQSSSWLCRKVKN